MMNKVILIGRLTADPEIRLTQNGTKVANYTLAVDRAIKSEGQPDADFLDCVAWAKGAEFAEKYLTKGTKIAIEGHIQTRTWEDQNGNKRKFTEVIVERHEFCEPKKTESSNNNVMPSAPMPFETGDDSDLPF